MSELSFTTNESASIGRRGVIGVALVESRFLVIRRSQSVIAPGKYCFPGGGIEAGETEQQALARELHEELGIERVHILKRLWFNITPWQTSLAWWQVELENPAALRANPEEVASHHWWTIEELLSQSDLLESNREFLLAWSQGEFELLRR